MKTSSTQARQNRTSSDIDIRRFFNLSIDMFCIANLKGYFELVNPAWERTLGFSIDEMLSRPFIEFIHPDDREPTNQKYALQIEQGKDIIEFENRYLCKDGSYRWLLWNAKTVPEEQLIYAVARDVTSAKRLESALAQKTLELERSNTELEDFTHIVSHDLKEPLRGIEAFAGFLYEDYAETLDEDGRKHVTIVRDSAVRMRDLIDDLLQLSRIGRVKAQYEETNVQSVLDEVVTDMQFALNERRAIVRIQSEMPTIVCDRLRLKQVFENLVGNAVKYNEKAQPLIDIEHEDESSFWTFIVRDNGIGMEPQYSDKIFKVFQRLVHRDDYEGTGVGLAICKKIVEGHGGEITCQSPGPGHGSQFGFSISKSIQPDDPRPGGRA